jgi:hypothetical protein
VTHAFVGSQSLWQDPIRSGAHRCFLPDPGSTHASWLVNPFDVTRANHRHP